MQLVILVKNRVKILFAGRTDGAAGKFDRITFVVVGFDVEDYTVVENIAQFVDDIEIWLFVRKLFGRNRAIQSVEENGFAKVKSIFAVNVDCTTVVPDCTLKPTDLNGIGIVFAIVEVQVSILMPSDHYEYSDIVIGQLV